MSSVSTHVLDLVKGGPAKNVPVVLEEQVGGEFVVLARGLTDSDGRVKDLVPRGSEVHGVFRITFDTDAYFASQGITGFYPSVSILFRIPGVGEHYHVPLLLGPYGYSTYRGS